VSWHRRSYSNEATIAVEVVVAIEAVVVVVADIEQTPSE